MARSMFSRGRQLVAAAVPLLLAAIPVHAAEGPFAGMAGNWSGNGSVSVSNGSNERIRCRATYSVTPSGETLHQVLRCASDSYKFDINSNVLAGPSGVLSGTWTETSRQVTGAISGQIQNGSISSYVKGPVFSATLEVNTKGDRQTVAIKPDTQEIKAITIELKRGG